MRFRSLASWIAILFFLTAQALQAQGREGNSRIVRETQLRGQLRLPNGVAGPIGILVVLEANGLEFTRVMTDGRGKFEAISLPATMITARVRQRGYRETTAKVDLSVSPIGNLTLDLIPEENPVAPAIPPEGPRSAISSTLPSSAKGRKQWSRASEALAAHQSEEAVKALRELTKVENGFLPGHLMLASTLMRENRYEEAETVLREATRIAPADATVLFTHGVCLNQMKRYQEAEAVLSESVKRSPEAVESRYELARTLFAEEKVGEAELEAREAEKLSAQFAPTHVLLGNIFLRKREPQLALKQFQEYLRLDPNGLFAEQTRALVERIQKALESNGAH